MPKGSEELVQSRRQEIIDACAHLYQKKGFREINIKDIGEITSFTRTSIYNYFQTKEEIFLALLKQENDCWVESLRELLRENQGITKLQFADLLAKTLEKRPVMLKILSMNLYDIEHNSRLEQLIEYKKTYKETIDELNLCLVTYFPEMGEKDREDFIYSFLAFLYGIYPYTFLTDNQKAAFEAVGLPFAFRSTYEVAFVGIKKLLEVSKS